MAPITKTPKNEKYPIHSDVARKLLSVVIYIEPKENVGTLLYRRSEKKSFNTVEWKPNRALIFSRLEEDTLHSYEGNVIDDRYTFNFNLMTHNEILACWSEPKIRSKYGAIIRLAKLGKYYIYILLKKITQVINVK